MLNICNGKKCGAAFSVGAPCCPQCGGTDFTPDHPTAAVDPAMVGPTTDAVALVDGAAT